MERIAVRRLTADGSARFEEILKAGGPEYAPWDFNFIVQDRALCESASEYGHVALGNFDNRYAFGVHLFENLHDERRTLANDAGVWNFLSMCFFEQLCPVGNDGVRKIGDVSRYLIMDDFRRQYRHLVRSSWMLCRDHGKSARLFLSGKMHVHGDMLEQVVSYQKIIGCRSLIEAMAVLYLDKVTGNPLRGITNRNKPGTIRRFIDVFSQLELAYDFASMESEDIAGILPKEFRRWLK